MEPIIRFKDFVFSSGSGFPAPSISVSIAKNRTSSYQYINSKQTIDLNGYIYFKNDSSFNDLFDKAMTLKSGIITPKPELFSISFNGSGMISGTGFVTSLSFDSAKNNGANILEYNVSIDIDSTTNDTFINNQNIYFVSDVDDNISINVSSNYYYSYDNQKYYPLYEITRNIFAKGNYMDSNSGSIVEALRWINDRRTSFPFTGIVSTGQFPLFNHKRDIELNELDGSINITDKFLSKPIEPNRPWVETFTIDTNVTEDLTHELTFKGTIQGLVPVSDLASVEAPFDIAISRSGQTMLRPFARLSSQDNKYEFTVSGYSYITGNNLIANRAATYYDSLLDSITDTNWGYTYTDDLPRLPINTGAPTTFTETFDPFKGEITYSIGYNNRPPPYISGAVYELITINDSSPNPRITNIPVLGRRLGPMVYFFVDSSGLGSRSVTYEGIFLSPTGINNSTIKIEILNAIENLVDSYKPPDQYKSYVVANDQKININENRITRTKGWSYTT